MHDKANVDIMNQTFRINCDMTKEQNRKAECHNFLPRQRNKESRKKLHYLLKISFRMHVNKGEIH